MLLSSLFAKVDDKVWDHGDNVGGRDAFRQNDIARIDFFDQNRFQRFEALIGVVTFEAVETESDFRDRFPDRGRDSADVVLVDAEHGGHGAHLAGDKGLKTFIWRKRKCREKNNNNDFSKKLKLIQKRWIEWMLNKKKYLFKVIHEIHSNNLIKLFQEMLNETFTSLLALNHWQNVEQIN